MKTTIAELARRVADLPPDFAEHVILRQGSHAKVKSFSSDTLYSVSIMMGPEDDERKVVCDCSATKLCKHVVSFYAVAKGIVQEEGSIPTPPPPELDKGNKGASQSIVSESEGQTGLQMIGSAIELLVNGIRLLVDEKLKENGKS